MRSLGREKRFVRPLLQDLVSWMMGRAKNLQVEQRSSSNVLANLDLDHSRLEGSPRYASFWVNNMSESAIFVLFITLIREPKLRFGILYNRHPNIHHARVVDF